MTGSCCVQEPQSSIITVVACSGYLCLFSLQGVLLHAGWDVFILWYDMKEPLSSIITGQAMAGYLRLFRLLWTLKRVEHTLNRVWQVMSGIQRQLATIQGLTSQYGLPCPGTGTPTLSSVVSKDSSTQQREAVCMLRLSLAMPRLGSLIAVVASVCASLPEAGRQP